MSGTAVTLYCTIESANKTFRLIGLSHAHGGGDTSGGRDVYQTDLYRCTSCGFVRTYPPKIAADP